MVIDELRRATGAHHAAIDRLLQLDGAYQPLRYRRILQGFDAYLSVWEPQLAAALPARLHAFFAEGCRGALVRADLAALGVAERCETPVKLPALPSVAAAFGSLYVLEGSALGGQVIARELARHGIGPQAGGSYFAGAGPATGARWRAFRVLLEDEVGGDAAARAQACRAAGGTFGALTDVFAALLQEPAGSVVQ